MVEQRENKEKQSKILDKYEERKNASEQINEAQSEKYEERIYLNTIRHIDESSTSSISY